MGWPRLSLLLTLSWHLAAGSAAAESRVAVAWDEGSSGKLAVVTAAPPFDFTTPVLDVGADGRVRAAFGRLLHLSRATGELRVLDAETLDERSSAALGAASGARDAVFATPDTLYVSRRDASHLLRYDVATEALTESTDLTPLGVGDGNPQLESLHVHEGRLYVQLVGTSTFPPEPHFLAVVDLATEQIVDADPSTPGLQAIPLLGTGPRFKMQVIPGTRQLLLSSTGSFHDFGGLESVDLDSLTSQGVVLEEWFDVSGNDLGAFVMLDADRGFAVFSTDIVLSSHLVAFTISGGGANPSIDDSLFYFAPHLVYDPETDTLIWPEPMGLQAFDGATGTALAPATPLPGAPTDIALIEAPIGIPALPRADVAFLALAFVLAAWWGGGRCARGRIVLGPD